MCIEFAAAFEMREGGSPAVEAESLSTLMDFEKEEEEEEEEEEGEEER